MQNVTVKSKHAVSSANAYAPSVPLSVYRELAAEMQANQAMLEFLRTQNQQLLKQNQHLRQEIDKLVESAIHLQQRTDSLEAPLTPTTRLYAASKHPELRGEAIAPPASPRTLPRSAAPTKHPELSETSPTPESLVTEQEEGRYRRPSPPQKSRDVSGVWLAFAIFLIVVITFGASFAIVRPLIQKR